MDTNWTSRKVWDVLVAQNKEEQFEYSARIWREGYSDDLDTLPNIEDIQVPRWKLIPLAAEEVASDRFFKGLAYGDFYIAPKMRSMEHALNSTRDYYDYVVGTVPLLRNEEYTNLLRTIGLAYLHVPENKQMRISQLYFWLAEYSLLVERKPDPEFEDRILDTGLTMALGSRIIGDYPTLHRAMSSPNVLKMNPDTILATPEPNTFMEIPSLLEATKLVWAVANSLM